MASSNVIAIGRHSPSALGAKESRRRPFVQEKPSSPVFDKNAAKIDAYYSAHARLRTHMGSLQDSDIFDFSKHEAEDGNFDLDSSVELALAIESTAPSGSLWERSFVIFGPTVFGAMSFLSFLVFISGLLAAEFTQTFAGGFAALILFVLSTVTHIAKLDMNSRLKNTNYRTTLR